MKSPKETKPKVLRRIPVGYMLFGILPLSACGGGGDEGGGVHEETFNLTGEVVKGPVSGAIVFVDYNGDGQLTAGEPSQRTSESGGFSFSGLDYDGPVIALTDGSSVDTSSGLVIDGMRLTAPEGASVISPLTTIMEEGNLSNAQVIAALNLPDIDLKSFNPFTSEEAAATNLAVEVAAQQVSVVVRSISTAIQQSGVTEADAANIAAVAVAEAVASVGIADFTSNGFITTAIEKVTSELSSSQASSVSAVASEIAAASANVNKVIAASTDLTSPETIDAFGLIEKLTKQIGDAITNDGDASQITFTDADTITNDDPATDDATVSETVTEATPTEETESTPETPQNAAPTGAVTISGTARQGETLTAITDTLDDPDSLGPLSYQWQSYEWVYLPSGSERVYKPQPLNGATDKTLTLTQEHVGKEITVTVSYTDGAGVYEQVTAEASGDILDINDAPTVTEGLVDTAGPVLNSFSVRDSALSPGEILYVDYEVTDTSDIDYISFRFDDVLGNSHSAWDTDDDGVAELSITDGMLSGLYEANSIYMVDDSDLSNYSTYYQDGDLYGDVTTTTHSFDLSNFGFTVDNPSTVDAVGPKLVSFSVRDSTLSPGEILYVDYEVTDTSGIDYISFRFDDVLGNSHSAWDTDDDGVAELSITDGMLSGLYEANSIYMVDDSDLSNYSTYYQDGDLYGDVTTTTHSFDLSNFGFTVDNSVII